MSPHPKSKNRRAKGFALVVALSLMILLTVIAVGLLTLAGVSLRSASQGDAMAAARTNARMALMLAIGDLQKLTGPDRAITAPSSLVDANNPHGVTGVWTPWEPTTAPDSRTKSEKDNRFRQWLVSTVDGKPAATLSKLPTVAAGTANSIALLGEGSLGKRSTDKGDEQRISVNPTKVSSGRTVGGMAYAVIDESTKARADLYEQNPDAKHASLTRLGSPPADGVRALTGLDGLSPDEKTGPLMVSMPNTALLPGVDREKLKVYHPDITVTSATLLTDVVSGGLKKDLSLWFSKGLSATEKTARLYRSSNVLATNNLADPPLGLLESYHQYFKNFGKRIGTANPGSDGVAANIPARYAPVRSDLASPVTPAEPVMVPSVVRVDVIFSLITRDVHGGRVNGLISAGRPYMLHLLYLPVVTLHNPYNVPLSVEGMKVTFRNVPVAMQFLVDKQPVTTGLVPINQMFVGSEGGPGATKDFSITLSSSTSGGTSSQPLKLMPGQTKLFGTPKVPANWTWANEQPGVGGDGIMLFDWRNNQTTDFTMAPKLMTDAKSGAGFDIDWLSPRGMQTETGRAVGAGEGLVTLRGTEQIGVNFGPYAPPAGNGSFNVIMQVKRNGAFVDCGAFSIKYGDATRLKAVVEKGTSLRFPSARSFPETFPKAGVDKPLTVSNLFEKSSTPISSYINARPFLIFSVGARTTRESFVPTRVLADGNPVMNIAKVDISSDRADPLGAAPLEMVMMPIRNGSAAIEDIRGTEEGFAFGGSGTLNGTPRATFYELPRAALQSLAQFRHANLAGSGFMPMVTYTAGESRAHPLIGTAQTTGTWTDRSVMLDHTWYSNEALWDRYFLSTIADQTSLAFSQAKAYTQVMSEFFGMQSRLPNQRFRPYPAAAAATPSELASGATPQDLVAASLMLEGGFNVNSTSEDAWVAVLSALREVPVETQAGVDPKDPGRTPMARVRRPTGNNIDKQAVAMRVNRWEGYRALNDAEIRTLAKEIIIEVRKRGPFLSLADFVNRGIGPDNDEINLKGALQAAIDRAKLNQQADFDGIDLTEAMVGTHGYVSKTAGTGNSATGAPGAISQGDLLGSLGSRITVRADTFRIRAYGEARDTSGKAVLARAWCEAVVQRVPEYVDPADAPSVKLPIDTTGGTATTNQTFGRRYEVVSFRWLGASEV